MFEKLKISDEVDYIPFEVDGVELKKTENLFTNDMKIWMLNFQLH